MLTIITQLTCGECDAALILTGTAPQKKAIRELAKEGGWQFLKAAGYCPQHAKAKPIVETELFKSPPLEPFFSVVVSNTQDKRSRYWEFRSWAKVITEIDLDKTGGYAFKGDNWLSSKYTTDETEGKYHYGKYPDFTLVAVGYSSGNHAACWIVEVDKAKHETGIVEFGRGELTHSISIMIKGGRVVFTATSKRPKSLVAQAVTWGATADMLKKVGNPNYYAAMYLKNCRDEWKYKNNPFAIEIEESRCDSAKPQSTP
jgi:hypothetical protein